MTIEVSDKKYWRKLNYYDGLLYCELLEIDGKNDWRMFNNTVEELESILPIYEETWRYIDGEHYSVSLLESKQFLVIPVRDI